MTSNRKLINGYVLFPSLHVTLSTIKYVTNMKLHSHVTKNYIRFVPNPWLIFLKGALLTMLDFILMNNNS